jgi:hypothetical protein
MPAHIDTIILHEELAYADVIPVRFRALDAPPDAAALAHWTERNLRMLQAASALEEHGLHEKPDEDSPHAADILRIDSKINLLLDLVGALLAASQSRPAPCAVRFNARAATWQQRGELPRPDAYGAVELHLRECLVQPLTLVGTVNDVAEDGLVDVRFDPIPEAVADQIEKLVFRRHRRQVAGVRHTRRS